MTTVITRKLKFRRTVTSAITTGMMQVPLVSVIPDVGLGYWDQWSTLVRMISLFVLPNALPSGLIAENKSIESDDTVQPR